jgi:hypothetical protein
MRANPFLATGAALVLVMGLAGAATADPAAVTFHGVFTRGTAYWSTGPADPVFTIQTGGRWNLNVNVAAGPDEARAQASLLVMVPGEGMSARWMENELALVPLRAQSVVADVVPALDGVVHDPAGGVYAFTSHVEFQDGTFVVVYDTGEDWFAYAFVPGPDFVCPAPSAEITECYDSVLIEGISR